MDKKAYGKVDPILLSQIENGIKVKDYLHEGSWIMEDIADMIETYKNGGYNNYVGVLGVSIHNNSLNIESNRTSGANYSSQKRMNVKYDSTPQSNKNSEIN